LHELSAKIETLQPSADLASTAMNNYDAQPTLL